MSKILPSSKTPIYSNYVMQAPDGVQLCRIDQKRADWYLSRDLAELIDNKTIKLKFEPSGRANVDDPFQQEVKYNICVVCGSTNDLTRHHIVPYCYRKHLSEEVKNYGMHDVVILCVDCHNSYEATVDDYKKYLSNQFNVPLHSNLDDSLNKAIKAAFAIKKHKEKLPSWRKKELESIINDYLGKKYTEEELNSLISKSPKTHSELVVEKLDCESIQSFFEGWRKHFVEKTNPQYMPEYWSITRKVQGVKNSCHKI